MNTHAERTEKLKLKSNPVILRKKIVGTGSFLLSDDI